MMERAKRCVFFTVLSATLVTVANAYSGDLETVPWLPSDNQTVNCPMYTNCIGDLCHFNGNASEPVSTAFYPNDELIVTCGNTIVDIVYPATKDRKFTGNKTYTCFQYDNGNGLTFYTALVVLTKPDDVKGSQLTCTSTQNNCALLNETSSLIIFVAGFPSSCVPWVPPLPPTTTPGLPTPSKTSEVVCFTENGIFPSHPAFVLKRRLLDSQKNVKYSGGMEAHVNCEYLEVSVKCPEDKHVMCSNVKNCYVYESSNFTSNRRFTVLELFVRKNDNSSNGVECRTRNGMDCPAFKRTATITGFTVGFPDSCVPKTKSIAENGVFLPSTYPNVVCKSYSLCQRSYACQYTGALVSSDVDRFSRDLFFTLSCSDLRIDISCSSGNGTANPFCSAVRKCYRYSNRFSTFNVMELSFRKALTGMYNDTMEINCKNNFNECPVFKETESAVKYIIGFPSQCWPMLPST